MLYRATKIRSTCKYSCYHWTEIFRYDTVLSESRIKHIYDTWHMAFLRSGVRWSRFLHHISTVCFFRLLGLGCSAQNKMQHMWGITAAVVWPTVLTLKKLLPQPKASTSHGGNARGKMAWGSRMQHISTSSRAAEIQNSSSSSSSSSSMTIQSRHSCPCRRKESKMSCILVIFIRTKHNKNTLHYVVHRPSQRLRHALKKVLGPFFSRVLPFRPCCVVPRVPYLCVKERICARKVAINHVLCTKKCRSQGTTYNRGSGPLR